MRFLGRDLDDRVPDATTPRLVRGRLTRAGAVDALFARLEAALRAAGSLAMAGQIVDASIVAAPRQRITDEEKRDLKAGRVPPSCLSLDFSN